MITSARRRAWFRPLAASAAAWLVAAMPAACGGARREEAKLAALETGIAQARASLAAISSGASSARAAAVLVGRRRPRWRQRPRPCVRSARCRTARRVRTDRRGGGGAAALVRRARSPPPGGRGGGAALSRARLRAGSGALRVESGPCPRPRRPRCGGDGSRLPQGHRRGPRRWGWTRRGGGAQWRAVTAYLDVFVPPFGLLALGALLRRFLLRDGAVWAGIERLVFWALMPALLLSSIASVDLAALPLGRMALAIWLALLGGTVLSLLLAWAAGLNHASMTSVLQGGIRFNNLMGFALAGSLYGAAGTVLGAVATGLIVPFVQVITVGASRWRRQARGAVPALGASRRGGCCGSLEPTRCWSPACWASRLRRLAGCRRASTRCCGASAGPPLPSACCAWVRPFRRARCAAGRASRRRPAPSSSRWCRR